MDSDGISFKKISYIFVSLPGLPNGKFKMGNCDGCVGATGWGLRDPHLVNVA